MEQISKIGNDLFEYFLSIYPEKTTVSICISDKFFQKFLDKHSVTINMVKRYFFRLDLTDPYKCLTIAVYQSTISVKKNITQSCYNKELCKELSISINELEKWYRDYQEQIWGQILKKLFAEKERALLLPDQKKWRNRYVQYPDFQFIISPEIQKEFNKTNLSFEEYSNRNFSYRKTYYDRKKLQTNKYYYKYSKENLNFVAKRIIYSFVLNDIKFAKRPKENTSNLVQKINKYKVEKHLVLMIEKGQVNLYTLQDDNIVPTSHIKNVLFYIFKYDESEKFWIRCNSKKITASNKYGILVAKSFIANNESIETIINKYWKMNNFYFLEILNNKNAIQNMCSIFHLEYDFETAFSFVGGLKSNNNEYYCFCLPIISLYKKANTLFINDKDIQVSSDIYDLNKYKEYIKDGENSFKTEVSDKYIKDVIKKENTENLGTNLGWKVDDKDFSIACKNHYHIQGLFIDDSIPQITNKPKNKLQINNRNLLYKILNKNLISQLQKGKINDF